RHIEHVLQERQFPIDSRRCRFGRALRHITLNVAGYDLGQGASTEEVLPGLALAGVVSVAAKGALDPFEVVVNHLRQQPVAPSDQLGKESALLHLVLALLVHLERQRLAAHLLAMNAPDLVSVAHPPDARALRALEDTALCACTRGYVGSF